MLISRRCSSWEKTGTRRCCWMSNSRIIRAMRGYTGCGRRGTRSWANGCCSTRRKPRLTCCRAACPRLSNSCSSLKKAVTATSTSSPASTRACAICASNSSARRKRQKRTNKGCDKRARKRGETPGAKPNRFASLLFRRFEIGFVQQIERHFGFGEQLVLAAGATDGALQQRLHSRGFCHLGLPRIERMDQGADARETGVLVQLETGENFLERDLVLAVAKRRAGEGEADCARRTFLVLVEPYQRRFRVDEAPDQPGRGQLVSQQGFARSPHASEILLAPGFDRAACLRRFREHQRVHRLLGFGQDARGALPRFRGEKIQCADDFVLALVLVEQTHDRHRVGDAEAGLEAFHGFDQVVVLVRAVEEAEELPRLRLVQTVYRKQVGRAVDAHDVVA